MASKTTVRVALDWTPNTIHTGLYVAAEKGYYADLGLDVQLLTPDAGYSTTPARRVESGDADLALCPSESCIAYGESGKMKLQAVYAILQKDASAIVSVKPEFARLAEFEKGTYGSYNARYEDHIVRAMVRADGGDGATMKIQSSTGKLTLFEEVKKGTVDATWIFLPWEGVEARQEKIELHTFSTEAFGVPYGYSPVIARDAASTKVSADALRKFLNATRRGYSYALEHPSEAANLLGKHCQPPRSASFVEESQKSINAYYGDVASLGAMDTDKWERWVEWLRAQKLLKADNVLATSLFTSEYLP